MVNQRCMMELDAPSVSRMSFEERDSTILIVYSLRAWTLLDADTNRWGDQSWKRFLERTDNGMALRIPVVSCRSDQWHGTLWQLSVLNRIVSGFRGLELDELTDEPNRQLTWIDALVLGAGIADVSVLASPEFARFIRCAPRDVFDRVTVVMMTTERCLTGKNDVPLTRGVSNFYGALHISVGEDCACLGVASIDLPRSANEGWEAHGHNLRFVSRILLVLAALAVLEDECRALRVT